MNLFARSLLFVSSYAPLGVLFFLAYFGQEDFVAWAALGLAAGGVAMLWLLLRWWKRDLEHTTDVVVSQRKPGGEVMGYMASYLLPFLGYTFATWRHVVVLAAYLAILGYLYVTTDMIRVNPTLHLLLGYRVYEVELAERGSRWLIARRTIRQGDAVSLVSLGADLVIEKEIPCTTKSSS